MQHIHDLSLHSTMFLLILIAVKLLLGLQAFTFHDVSINTDTTQSRKDSVLNFTFHDVSINTAIATRLNVPFNPLHSTMFLLILEFRLFNSTLHAFTFHDVSINTSFVRLFGMPGRQTLHSTMFLLIPVVYLSLQYRYNLTTFCQSCHFIIFILIFIFLDSSHF